MGRANVAGCSVLGEGTWVLVNATDTNPLSRTVHFVVVLAALSIAVGCARGDNWVQTYPDVAARARQDPASFLVAAQAQWDDLQGMVGSYQVRASRGISSRTLDTQIHLLREGFVQIEVLAPTFTSEGYLGVGTREVGLWVSEDRCLYRGPNEPGAFGRALGLDLTPESIVATLMGFAIPADTAVTSVWDEGEQRVRVSGGATTAWLHPVTARFERLMVSTASGPITVVYEAWSSEGPPVPLRARIEVAAEDITLQLRLAPTWNANPSGLNVAFFDDMRVDGSVDCPLDRLAVEGGLLRRGLSR